MEEKGVGEPGNSTCTGGLIIRNLIVSDLLASKISSLAYNIFGLKQEIENKTSSVLNKRR